MPKLIVTGDKKIDAMIRRLGDPKATNAIVRRNMRAAMKPVAAAARLNVPSKSGAMRKAIKLRAGGRSRKGPRIVVSILAAELAAANPKLAGKAGAFYAAGVEHGDKNQDAQTPMKRTYDAEAGAARDRTCTGIRNDLIARAKG